MAQQTPFPVLTSIGNCSYLEILQSSLQVASVYFATPWSHYRLPDVGGILESNPNIWFDGGCCLAGAITLIVFRMYLASLFINTINPKLRLVKRTNQGVFLESFYIFLASSAAFSTAYYAVHTFNLLPLNVSFWNSHNPKAPLPRSIWILYIFSLSHYLHCLYAVFYLNPWTGADSIVLLVHHAFTLLLLSISHLLKIHYFGVVTLYLHDICDVILEAIKLGLKLETSSSWAKRFVEVYKVVLFGLLLFFWFYFRLIVFPLKIIYEEVLFFAGNPVEEVPVMFVLLGMLWIVFLLSSYWAFLLLKILYKTICQGIDNIEDIREVEEKEELTCLKEKQN